MNILDIMRLVSITSGGIIVLIIMVQYISFIRIKMLHKGADYKNIFQQRTRRRFRWFLPKADDYKKTSELLVETGINLSVEAFYGLKWFLLLAALMIIPMVFVTNSQIWQSQLKKNLNMERLLIDEPIIVTEEKIQLEEKMFNIIQEKIKIDLKKLKLQETTEMGVQYIEHLLKKEGFKTDENIHSVASRLYEKIIKYRVNKNNVMPYLIMIMVVLGMFFIPDIFVYLKKFFLAEDKDIEVLNMMYVYSIFGSIPPFKTTVVVENMILVSRIYKPILVDILDKLNKGEGVKAFDDALKKIKNPDMQELIESLKEGKSIGIENTVEDMEDRAESLLEWIKIQADRKRMKKMIVMGGCLVAVGLIAFQYMTYGVFDLIGNMSKIS